MFARRTAVLRRTRGAHLVTKSWSLPPILLILLLRLFHHVALAGGEEEVGFEAVLAGVEVEVASA